MKPLIEGWDSYPEPHKEILSWDGKGTIVWVAGRRVGKTHNFSALLLKLFLTGLYEDYKQIKEGKKTSWLGTKQTRAQDIRLFQDGIRKANVITATTDQYQIVQSYIRTRLALSGHDKYLHTNEDLVRCDRGREMWFKMGKAGGVIKFRCASQAKQLQGDSAQIIWIDEAGLIDNTSYYALRPMLWEHKGATMLSGTPDLDESHFFTKIAVSGLPDDDPRVRKAMGAGRIEEKKEDVLTYLTTSLEAFLPKVREESKKDLEEYGSDSLFVRQFILADWRIPGVYIFDNWDPAIHMVSWREVREGIRVKLRGKEVDLPRPDKVIGGKDWFQGVADGGYVVAYYWSSNPLEGRHSKRPLLLVVGEGHGKHRYTNDGWWGMMMADQEKYGVQKWLADPSDKMYCLEARRAGLHLVPASNPHKLGRVGAIRDLLHSSDKVEPAILISGTCPTLIYQINKYQRKISKWTGEVSEEAKQENDDLIDSLAYIVGSIYSYVVLGGGAIG